MSSFHPLLSFLVITSIVLILFKIQASQHLDSYRSLKHLVLYLPLKQINYGSAIQFQDLDFRPSKFKITTFSNTIL